MRWIKKENKVGYLNSKDKSDNEQQKMKILTRGQRYQIEKKVKAHNQVHHCEKKNVKLPWKYPRRKYRVCHVLYFSPVLTT